MKALHTRFTWHDSPSNSLRKARNKFCIANANTACFLFCLQLKEIQANENLPLFVFLQMQEGKELLWHFQELVSLL